LPRGVLEPKSNRPPGAIVSNRPVAGFVGPDGAGPSVTCRNGRCKKIPNKDLTCHTVFGICLCMKNDPTYRDRFPAKRASAVSGARGPRGRGAGFNPANRFERQSLAQLDNPGEAGGAPAGEPLMVDRWAMPDGGAAGTEVYEDHSRSILNRVDSPDLGLRWTVNPYRGCEHGCVYCYARPTHETLGFSAGLDFESKLMAKVDASKLLRKEIARPGWRGEPIALSGVTDPYQPIEARLKITRSIMELFAETRQPVGVVTKSRLVLRDLDLLAELARHNAARVAVSLTTLDNDLASRLEPRASSPRDRLWAIQRLASAGVPVSVMVAPIVPALTDRETPKLLKAAADAGARAADYVMLRLPHATQKLFADWLERHYPNRRAHVLGRLREMHGGALYDARLGARLRGEGPYAEQVRQTFEMFRRRLRLDASLPPMASDGFRRPDASEQLALFDAA